jgi:hypothetical protein
VDGQNVLVATDSSQDAPSEDELSIYSMDPPMNWVSATDAVQSMSQAVVQAILDND